MNVKRIAIVGIMLMLLSFSNTMTYSYEKAERGNFIDESNDGRTLYVGGSGPNNYTKIQDAINNASDGDTIIVYPGIYKESIIINKNLSLLGKIINDKRPIIDGGKNNFTVEINKYCLLKKFEILNEKQYGIAVKIFSSAKFFNNTIRTFFNGSALLALNSSFVVMGGNEIYETNYGFLIKNCSYCNIYDNTFSDVNDYCIFLYNSSGCNIYDNEMENIRWLAISSVHSTENNILNNDIKGIEMTCCDDNSIFNNNISGKIELEKSNHNKIIRNRVKGKIYLRFSVNNFIKDNFFEYGGIRIDGSAISNWNTHIIVNNTLQNKPILYYKNAKNITIVSNASEIIIANCSRCTIRDIEIKDTLIGIQVGFSSQIKVSNCYFSHNEWGILVFFSNNISINDNLIKNSNVGVSICSSNYSVICKNYIERNNIGLNIYDSQFTYLKINNINQNDIGVEVGDSFCNFIIGNNITENDGGIDFHNSLFNFIFNNNFVENDLDTFVVNSFVNIFIRNYWSKWRTAFPKPIICTILYPGLFHLKYIIFDLLPRINPYRGV